MQEVPQYPRNAGREYLVANPEIKAKKKRSDKNHHRRAVNLLPVRPSHPFHLRPNVGEIIAYLDPRALLDTDLLAHNFFSLPTTPPFRPGLWQGRRDLNPHDRFWRPAD